MTPAGSGSPPAHRDVTGNDGGPARLGPLETQVMDVLWEHEPLTIRQIIDELPNRPAYTTIATVLANLDRKAMVRSARQGRSVLYRPRLSRDDYATSLMQQALGASRDRATSILHLVQTLPDDDLNRLREYLSDRAGRER